jgi:transcriptional antiterminator RfaH
MAAVSENIGLYPHDLLESAGEDSPERRWWVVYTKSRQEKVFCRQLMGLEVPHYLPLVKKISYCRGRRISAQVPLFSGYVFMHGADEDRALSLTTNRISQILPVTDGARLRYDLRQISRLIASGAPVTVEQRLAPGRRVRIRQGALAGLEGTILERRGGRRLFVAVDLLQQGASIDLEDFRLEPID